MLCFWSRAMFRTPRLANGLLILAALLGAGLLVALVSGHLHHWLFQAALVCGLLARGAAEWSHAEVWRLRRRPASPSP
jgi:hypothetical protein